MNGFRGLTLCALMTLPGACSTGAAEISGESIGAVVTNVVKYAESGEAGRFATVFEPDDRLPSLMTMIQRSGMSTNYMDRLEQHSPTNARLNYHWLERHCHFQVELAKTANLWRVTRIGYCR